MVLFRSRRVFSLPPSPLSLSSYRVKLQRQLAVRALDLGVAGAARHLQDFVIVFAAGGARSGGNGSVSVWCWRAPPSKHALAPLNTQSLCPTHRASTPAASEATASSAHSAAATAPRRSMRAPGLRGGRSECAECVCGRCARTHRAPAPKRFFEAGRCEEEENTVMREPELESVFLLPAPFFRLCPLVALSTPRRHGRLRAARQVVGRHRGRDRPKDEQNVRSAGFEKFGRGAHPRRQHSRPGALGWHPRTRQSALLLA